MRKHAGITKRIPSQLYGLPIVIVLGVAVLVTVNNFQQHCTPDMSMYLLHARTFVETGQRYLVSHDSKGPVLVWLYALPVFALGPTVVAAAALQALLHSAFALLLYRSLRVRIDPRAAASVALLSFVLVSAPALWGSGMRSEDAALPAVVLMYALLHRRSPAARGAAGAVTALLCGMKISFAPSFFVFGIAGILAAEATVDSTWRWWSRDIRGALIAYGGGALVTAGLLIGLVAASDSLTEAFRQTVLWPMHYRSGPGFGPSPLHPVAVLWHSKLGAFVAASLIVLVFALQRRNHRALPLLMFVCMELLRMSMEGTRWNYHALPLLPALILAPALLSTDRIARLRMYGLQFVLLLPVLLPQCVDEVAAFSQRVVQGRSTPYEYLARRMAPYYSSDESVFVASNDYQLLLLLHAPRPWPILPYHEQYVSEQERRAFRQHYAQHPPTWIVTRDTLDGSSLRLTRGSIDGAYHVYVPGVMVSVEGTIRSARALTDGGVAAGRYRCMVDIGWAQAWRRL